MKRAINELILLSGKSSNDKVMHSISFKFKYVSKLKNKILFSSNIKYSINGVS